MAPGNLLDGKALILHATTFGAEWPDCAAKPALTMNYVLLSPG